MWFPKFSCFCCCAWFLSQPTAKSNLESDQKKDKDVPAAQVVQPYLSENMIIFHPDRSRTVRRNIQAIHEWIEDTRKARQGISVGELSRSLAGSSHEETDELSRRLLDDGNYSDVDRECSNEEKTPKPFLDGLFIVTLGHDDERPKYGIKSLQEEGPTPGTSPQNFRPGNLPRARFLASQVGLRERSKQSGDGA